MVDHSINSVNNQVEKLNISDSLKENLEYCEKKDKINNIEDIDNIELNTTSIQSENDLDDINNDPSFNQKINNYMYLEYDRLQWLTGC